MTDFLKGQRTRIFAGLVFLLGIFEMFTPNLISDAIGVGSQGRAIVTILIGVAIVLLRQITTTPPGKQL